MGPSLLDDQRQQRFLGVGEFLHAFPHELFLQCLLVDLGSDLIDLRGILEEDDNVLVGDLIDSITAEVDGDDVVMTVTDEGREQTIILEGVTNAFEDAGLVENNSITSELEMLTQVLKTDAA